MLELKEVPEIAVLGGPKTMFLQLIYDYTVKLKKVSPVTASWIPLSEDVCKYMLTVIATGLLYRAMAELEVDGYLETKKFSHSCPECRCKWFRLTDKFYDLLKGIE